VIADPHLAGAHDEPHRHRPAAPRPLDERPHRPLPDEVGVDQVDDRVRVGARGVQELLGQELGGGLVHVTLDGQVDDDLATVHADGGEVGLPDPHGEDRRTPAHRARHLGQVRVPAFGGAADRVHEVEARLAHRGGVDGTRG